MDLTGNATRDGARLLDEVEGDGEAERWTNMCLGNGGIVCATPWLFFLGYPLRDEPHVLYVPYLYGDRRAVADFSMSILRLGTFTHVEFRKNFLKGDAAEGPWRYDRRFVERLWRLTNRKGASGERV